MTNFQPQEENDTSWLSSDSQNPRSSSHSFQTFHPDSHLIATGWLEQLRRSKLSRTWKTVLVSLVKEKTSDQQQQVSLWIQRQAASTLETLHQFPIHNIHHVEMVNDAVAAGENRFVIRVHSLVEDIVFRCPRDRDAVRKWISTIRYVNQFHAPTLRTETFPKPVEEDNLISFDNDAVVNRRSDATHRWTHQHTHNSPVFSIASSQQSFSHDGPVSIQSFNQLWQQPSLPIQQHQYYALPPQQQQQQQGQRFVSPQTTSHAFNTPNMQAQPTTFVPNQPPPQMNYHHPSVNQHSAIPRAPVSQPPPRLNPPLQQPPLSRSSSAPTKIKVPPPHALKHSSPSVTCTYTHAQIKQRVMMEWALRPPAYLCVRDLSLLIPSLHTNFALVPPHEYFCKWKSTQKTARHARFFLHPDKWPKDLSPDQAFLLKLLWDVINDAASAEDVHK